jgi:cob(I)alamin adenosyltransferase
MPKIYTRTGDKGLTSLVAGSRVSKNHPLLGLYGNIDEVNSHIGFLRALLPGLDFPKTQLQLSLMQNNLFILGSHLACEPHERKNYLIHPVKNAITLELETFIDDMTQDLKPLTNFILPGGSQAAAYAHVCRTVVRESERLLVEYLKTTDDAEQEGHLIFLNRLSDYFFVLARWINYKLGITDVLWVNNQ